MRRSSGFGLTVALASCLFLCVGAARADFDPKTGARGGDAAAASFDEYCAGDLSPERRSRFFAQLDEAEAALAARDVSGAESAFGSAFEAAYRGGADSPISIKCLGETVARRWFRAQLELDRQRSERTAQRSRFDPVSIRVLAAEEGADAVVTRVERLAPREFVSSVRVLEGTLERIEADRSFGAFVLSEERALEQTGRDALLDLRAYADREHRRVLALEADSFANGPTESERATSEGIADAQALVEAFAGAEVGLEVDEELLALRNRTRASRELLETARLWNLERVADRRMLPSSRRARERGDDLRARARDTSARLSMRDALYEAARKYYAFGGFDDAEAAVSSEQAALEPALRAERARRDEAIQRASDRLEGEAEAMRQSIEDMKKSDSERKSFEDEAEALEDELGF